MIERIYIRPARGSPMVEHERVRVDAGHGIVGDIHYGLRDQPGQNVTFVEAEEIEAFLAEHEGARDLSRTGRNVVTRGVRLNDLVGVEFGVGTVRFRGVELCEPCRKLGRALQTPQRTPAQVVKRLVHRMGLRADALTSGEIAVGAAFE